MVRIRLSTLIVAVMVILAPLGVVAVLAEPAHAASPTQWTCWRTKTYGKLRYRGEVHYTTTTQHRVSINRVTVEDAYWFPNEGGSRRIGLTSASVVAWVGPFPAEPFYRWGGTPEDWTGASAAFFWPTKWIRATTADSLAVRIDMDSTAVGAGWCQAQDLFYWA